MRSTAANRGFSLLEVMVAFTILALVLGALFHVFSNGMSAARASDRYTRATVIAQSKLDALGIGDELIEGVTSGTADDDFHWRLTISPYTDDQLPASNSALEPLSVEVEVFWEDSGLPKTLTLRSLLLGQSPK